MLKKIAAGAAVAGMVAAGLGLGIAAPASASTGTLPGIASLADSTVTAQLARDKIPGASVVVVANGRQVLARGYGVADVASKRPVDAGRTGFFSGSVAKVFTATAAAQLISAGKLDPKADVNTYLGAFKAPFRVADTYPGRPVTLENLLTHTAGFDDNPVGVAVTDPANVPQLGRYLADHQPARVRPPGTLTAYDNYGVALAGYLVELASGTPFAQYVQQHVLAPLGMTGTTFAQPHPAAIQAELATGYRPEGATGQVAENGQYGAWSPTGAGTAVTATDMGRFMLAQLSHDPRLGSGVAALVQQQHFQQDPRLPGMAYLLEERPRNGHTLLFKDGDVPGFHSNMAMLPDDGLGIFVVYNGDGEDGVANWDGKALIDRIVDRYLPDTRPQPHAVAGAAATGLAGTYRSDRTSRAAVTKAAALVSPVTVAVASDGSLTTSGLSADPNAADQHWIPVGSGIYQERGGQERITFDGAGHLFSTQDPTVAYEKNGWSQSPTLHLILLGFGVLTLLVALIAFPVTALARKLRGRTPTPAGAKAARLTAIATGALATVFTAGFVSMTSDGNAFNETVILGSASLTALLALNTAATLTTAGMVVATAAAWTHGWWGRTGRLLYTATTLGAIAFLTVAFTYNLVWTPLG